jgi:P pilus assembly chaperone PapD
MAEGLSNIPVVSSGYKIQVTEAPVVKTRRNAEGVEVPVTDFAGAMQYVVMLFIKPRAVDGKPAAKGMEIKCTLETDPGDEVDEGDRVELINPRVSHWQNDFTDGNGNSRTMSGLSWKATGIKLAG